MMPNYDNINWVGVLVLFTNLYYSHVCEKIMVFQIMVLGPIHERGLISPSPEQEGNKLQRPNLGFIQHTPHEAQYTS